MGGFNKLSDSVRGNMITNIIDSMVDGEGVNKIYANILVVNPETQEYLFEGIPEHHIKNGCVTLDVSPSAVGMFNMSDGFIHTQIRFSGKLTDLFIPVGIVVNLSALSVDMEAIHKETFLPYINQAETPVMETKPVEKKSHLSLV